MAGTFMRVSALVFAYFNVLFVDAQPSDQCAQASLDETHGTIRQWRFEPRSFQIPTAFNVQVLQFIATFSFALNPNFELAQSTWRATGKTKWPLVKIFGPRATGTNLVGFRNILLHSI
jgi:hypothetical protein